MLYEASEIDSVNFEMVLKVEHRVALPM